MNKIYSAVIVHAASIISACADNGQQEDIWMRGNRIKSMIILSIFSAFAYYY